jgi:hypothetical protein
MNNCVTVQGIVTEKTHFPHNISHVDLGTEDGLLIVETDRQTADALNLGNKIKISGTIRFERTCRFLIDVTGIWSVE